MGLLQRPDAMVLWWVAGVQFFQAEGCAMVEMSCEDHDRIAASTQVPSLTR